MAAKKDIDLTKQETATAAEALAYGPQLVADVTASGFMAPGEIYWAYGYQGDNNVEQSWTARGEAVAYRKIAALFAGRDPAHLMRIWVLSCGDNREVTILRQAAGTVADLRETVSHWQD